jgi:chromosome partitioning protein
MPYTVAIANQKGGVGKTTTAVTVAAGLAAAGRRVLLIDLDSQGHVGFSLGMDEAGDIFRLIIGGEKLTDVVTTARPGLDVIRSNASTAKAKQFLAIDSFKERVIADLIDEAAYDVVILDMAPSLDILHVAGLVAADFALIPTRLDALALDGIDKTVKTMATVSKAGFPVKGMAILPCQFDRVTRETITQLETLTSHFPNQLWAPIPMDTRVREAPAYGKTLWEYAPETAAVVGYDSQKVGKKIGGYAAALERLKKVIFNGQ